jgi:hypothetical protein
MILTIYYYQVKENILQRLMSLFLLISRFLQNFLENDSLKIIISEVIKAAAKPQFLQFKAESEK